MAELRILFNPTVLGVVIAATCFSLGGAKGFAKNTTTPQASVDLNPMPQTKEQMVEWARARLWHEEFDALDAAAQKWRETKEEYPDGTWKLNYMYAAMTSFSNTAEENATWLKRAQKWMTDNPDSITARITVAQMLTERAWRARGSGYADTVTEEGEAQMQAYLKEAWEVLSEAAKLKAKCPHWWSVGNTVALGQGWDIEKYMQYFDMAVEFEPEYYDFYTNAMYYLLPRWYGEEGDSQRFLVEATNKVPGEKGDILYARLLGSLLQFEPEQSYQGELASFEKLDRGYVAIRKKYPSYTQYYTLWSVLCVATGTPENEPARKSRARELLAEMNKIAPNEIAQWETGQAIQEWANTP